MSTRPISGRETVPGFLRDLNVRLSRLERHSHGTGGPVDAVPRPPQGGGVNEVAIASTAASNIEASVELWYDPNGVPSGGGGATWWPTNYNELAAGPP